QGPGSRDPQVGGTAMKPAERRTRPPEPDTDPWRYGTRYLRHVRSDGTEWYERVPLKKEDLLFPEEEDHPVTTEAHRDDCVYLEQVAKRKARRHPGRLVLRENRIDFGVRGIQPLEPDLAMFDGVAAAWDPSRATFPVRAENARTLLTVEVTSPDTRRPNDLQ